MEFCPLMVFGYLHKKMKMQQSSFFLLKNKLLPILNAYPQVTINVLISELLDRVKIAFTLK